MRPQCKWALSALLAGLLILPVLGQDSLGSRVESLLENGVDAPILLNHDGVKKEIRLTREQSSRVNKIIMEVFDKYQPDLRDALGDKEKRQKLIRDSTQETRERVRKELPDILEPGQLKRLNQIQIQANGILSFKRKEVQEKLKLTLKQKLEILKIGSDLKQEVTQVFNDASQMPLRKMPAALRKSNELRDAATQKALDTLTREQKKIWKEMTGEKFDFKFELPIRPGRRPRARLEGLP